MVERIYDTLKGILYNDLPKNAKDQVVVYDRPIIGWYFGDRDVKPSSLSLIFYGTSIPLKDVSLGLQEYEHRITIGVDAGADNVELSERLVLEATRLVLSVLTVEKKFHCLDLNVNVIQYFAKIAECLKNINVLLTSKFNIRKNMQFQIL